MNKKSAESLAHSLAKFATSDETYDESQMLHAITETLGDWDSAVESVYEWAFNSSLLKVVNDFVRCFDEISDKEMDVLKMLLDLRYNERSPHDNQA